MNRRARPSTRRSRSVKRWKTAAVQRRWEQDRQKALHKRAQERRQEALWQEQVLDEQRARAIQLARAKKLEEQADLDQRPRDGLSGRSQPRTGEAKRAEMNDPMEMRMVAVGSCAFGSRTDSSSSSEVKRRRGKSGRSGCGGKPAPVVGRSRSSPTDSIDVSKRADRYA